MSLAIPGQPVTVVGNPWARNENAPRGKLEAQPSSSGLCAYGTPLLRRQQAVSGWACTQ
jgi:hypothetical protein